MKERIENGVCYGELGHPADREETDMEKIAVCMAEQPRKGSDGKLRAVFDILNTPNGRILKSLCDYGSTLGISSRGSGDLETDFDGNESVNPDTYNCEGFDVVLIPAVKEARLQYVTESLHLNEGAVNPKHKINLEAREFNYTMQYGTDSQDIHSAVVVIPNGLKFEDGSTIDATVHCEDVNGKVIDFTSVEEAQEWIDNYGDSCLYYVVNGDELHATPKEAYDIDRAIALESIDLNKKRYNKTLRDKLQESISKETEEHQRVMKESLGALGIDLDESVEKIHTKPLTEEANQYTVVAILNTKTHGRDSVEKEYFNCSTKEEAIKKASELKKEGCDEVQISGPDGDNDFKFKYKVSYVNSADKSAYTEVEAYSEEEAEELAEKNLGNECFRIYKVELISESLDESLYLSKDWKTLKVGDEVRWTSKEFDGTGSWDCEVKEVYPDHIIISPIDERFSDMNLWVDDDTIDDIIAESLSLTEASLSPEDKMDMWHDGERRENIKSCGDAKLYKYRDICERKNYDREVDLIDDELIRRGLTVPGQSTKTVQKPTAEVEPPKPSKPKCQMRDGKLYILVDDAGKDFVSRYVAVGVIPKEVLANGKECFVIDKSEPYASELASDLLKYLNESYMVKTISEAFDLQDDKQEDIPLDIETDNVADNDGTVLEELQQLLSSNKQLQEKIINLQEKLSVSYTKEMSLKEELNNEKVKSGKLAKLVSEKHELNEQLASARRTENTLNNKCTKLTESIERKTAKMQQLVEQVAVRDEQLKSLQKKIDESAKSIKEKENSLRTISEKYDTLNKDYQQMKESYSKKIEKQNELVEKYRDVAIKSVNKYIDTQAVRLGVTSVEIKNRLPESYSFSDIDRVCEDLQEYKLNMSNLPFSTGKKINENINVRVNNIDNRTLIPMEEELDDLTLRLAGL